jgi:hypothetical protein
MLYHHNICGSHDSYSVHSCLLGYATVSVYGYIYQCFRAVYQCTQVYTSNLLLSLYS